MTVNIFGNLLQLILYFLENTFNNNVFSLFIYIIILNTIIWLLKRLLFAA